MNNQSRFYLKNSWLIYTFICLLSGFILFSPMLIAIFSDYNSVSNIAFSPKDNLSITIVIMITSVFVTLIYSFFQYREFEIICPEKRQKWGIDIDLTKQQLLLKKFSMM